MNVEGDRPEGAPPPPKPRPISPRPKRPMYSDLPAADRLRVVEILRDPFREALAELAAEREHAQAA